MNDTSREWFKDGEDFSADVLLHISENGACGRMPGRECLIEGYIRKEIDLEVHNVLRVDDHLCYFVAIFESAESDQSEFMNRTRSSTNLSRRDSASYQNRESVFVSIPELMEEMKIGGGLPFRSVVRLLVHNPLLNFTGEPFYLGEVFRRGTAVRGLMEFETKSFISAVELPQAPDEVINYCSKVVDRVSSPKSQEQRYLTPNPESVLDTASDMRQKRRDEFQHFAEVLWRFKGVGQIDAEALAGAEAVAGIGEFQADLHVADGVGGHQEFEAVQAGQEMVFDIVVPELVKL